MIRSRYLLASLLALALAGASGPAALPGATGPATAAAAAPAPAAPTAPTAPADAPVAPRAGDDPVARTVGVLVSAERRCTATLVTSTSGSVLATAAHCVYWSGRWHLDDARFAPGYADDRSPLGVWAVDSARVSAAWRDGPGRGAHPDATNGAPAHDVAFVRLLPDERGRTAQEVLGARGIRFDTRPGGRVDVYGYPATGRYDGRSLRHCRTTTAAAALPAGTALAAGCGLTPGASGGPWLTGADGRVGAVTSLYEYGTGRNYASPFDAEAQRLYAATDRAG